MNIERLVTNATAIESPDRAERAILGVMLAGRFFLANPGRICGRGQRSRKIALWIFFTVKIIKQVFQIKQLI